MPEYRQVGGGPDGDAPCECRECECEVADECAHPQNLQCPCKGKCCKATDWDDALKQLLEDQRENVPA